MELSFTMSVHPSELPDSLANTPDYGDGEESYSGYKRVIGERAVAAGSGLARKVRKAFIDLLLVGDSETRRIAEIVQPSTRAAVVEELRQAGMSPEAMSRHTTFGLIYLKYLHDTGQISVGEIKAYTLE